MVRALTWLFFAAALLAVAVILAGGGRGSAPAPLVPQGIDAGGAVTPAPPESVAAPRSLAGGRVEEGAARRSAQGVAWPESGVEVSGRVLVEGSGTPIGGAQVVLVHGEQRAESVTDDQGRFRLTWPAEWEGDLSVHHPAYVDRTRPAIDPESFQHFALVPSGSIRARVLRGGAPLAGARLRLWYSSAGRFIDEPLAEGESAADGSFAFEDLEAGIYAICAEAEGHPPAEQVAVVVSRGSATDLLLSVPSPSSFAGRVLLRSTREPVAGLRVRARSVLPALPRPLFVGGEASGRCDEEGNFRLEGLASGEARLVIELPWGGVLRRPIEVSGEESANPAVFLVDRPGRLRGTIRDSRGSPIPGARLVLRLPTAKSRLDHGPVGSVEETSAESAGLFAGLDGGEPALTLGTRRIVVADAEGNYDASDLPPGVALGLIALPPAGENSLSASDPDWVLLRPAGTLEHDFVLPSARRLHGRVIDGEGQGLAEVRVVASLDIAGVRKGRKGVELGDLRFVPLSTVVTDAQGRFVFDGLPSKAVRLTAEAPEYIGPSLLVDPMAGSLEHPVQLILQGSLDVSGRVTDPWGYGIPGVRVDCVTIHTEVVPSGGLGPSPPKVTVRKETHTDGAGTFRLEGFPPGECQIKVQKRGYERSKPRRVTVAGGWVEITLRPRPLSIPGTLVGELVAAGTGKALPDIEFFGVHGRVRFEGTHFRIEGVSPGSLHIEARAKGFERIRFPRIRLQEGGLVDLGRYEVRRTAGIELDLRSSQGGIVTGAQAVLVRRDRTPSPGVILPEKVPLRYDPRTKHYQVQGVSPCEWKLRIVHPRYESRSLIVRPGRKELIRVALTPRAGGEGGNGSGKKKGAGKRDRGG